MSSSSEYEIGYKVLSNERTSVIMGRLSHSGHKAGCLYPIHEKVKPRLNCGPLCIFSHLNFANTFIGLVLALRNNYIIVKCQYKPSKNTSAYSTKHTSHIKSLPKGTVLADSVTCLE